ncbi:hypothetical protein H2200_011218 [Cladophialophora chaetospira]|uniref:RBR-type E3 ubiquitin transferase n=1 Tax=Cladophialophora chaetospira TaxID=386627 RepID=A0AA39CDL8_9EURO|nr:hypothetical protein H2200_011218 [Cladophialophora chaetospira]
MLIHNFALADEVSALNAIYGAGLVVATFSDSHHTTLSLKFPAFGFSFLLRVYADYPLSAPEVLGIDDLMDSRKPEVQQNTVYLGACVRAVHYPDYVCLFDAIDEFEMIMKTLPLGNQGSSDKDEVTERKPTSRASVLRDLALRTRAKAGLDRGDNFTGNLPFDAIDCSSCLEPFFRVDTANLKCKHSLCSECLHGKEPVPEKSVWSLMAVAEGVSSMFIDRSELKCCGESVPVPLIRQHGGFEEEFLERYVFWLQEFRNPNPTYCPWKKCRSFIPKRFIREDYTECPFCKQRICMGCKAKEHGGMCRQDKRLKMLIQKEEWRFCPCGQLVERSYGCNHMTCRCGAKFCYKCGKPSKGDWACGCG